MMMMMMVVAIMMMMMMIMMMMVMTMTTIMMLMVMLMVVVIMMMMLMMMMMMMMILLINYLDAACATYWTTLRSKVERAALKVLFKSKRARTPQAVVGGDRQVIIINYPPHANALRANCLNSTDTRFYPRS